MVKAGKWTTWCTSYLPFSIMNGELDSCTSSNNRLTIQIFFKDIRNALSLDELGREIARIAFPAALALTADPIASLVDTAFIGQIGPVQLAAVGVSIALFNQISRIAIFPLVSVTTSSVAEEDATTRGDSETEKLDTHCLEKGRSEEHNFKYLEESGSLDKEDKALIPKKDPGNIDFKSKSKPLESSFNIAKSEPQGRRHIPSASSALALGSILGIMQAIFLIAGATPLLNFMGIGSDSPMLSYAKQYLTLRSLGAPAVLLSLATQGVFRGLKDTTTPLYATVAGDLTNIILDPIFIFVFQKGVSGAAVAHVISQYVMAVILLWRLAQQVDLIPPNIKTLQIGQFLRNSFLLLIRVVAVTFCVTLSASLAARHGATTMAAFQICLQVWLATSLLADGLAVAGQAILASAFAKKEYERATASSSRVLQLGLVLGLALTALIGIGLNYGATLFTKDHDVLKLISIGIPFVAGTQPMNALAFVFDGINFGASDYSYSACSMLIVAFISIFCLLALSAGFGFVGLWIGLTIYMSLRAFAGFWRIGTRTGPWEFLRN